MTPADEAARWTQYVYTRKTVGGEFKGYGKVMKDGKVIFSEVTGRVKSRSTAKRRAQKAVDQYVEDVAKPAFLQAVADLIA